MLEIPLTSQPEQIFSLETPTGVVDVRVIANLRLEKWNMSTYYVSEGERIPIITGIALLPGVNILDQYPELPYGEVHMINIDNKNEDPKLDNLGTVNKMVIIESSDVAPVPS